MKGVEHLNRPKHKNENNKKRKKSVRGGHVMIWKRETHKKREAVRELEKRNQEGYPETFDYQARVHRQPRNEV